MEVLKLVITGAYGAGKTSFIRTISEIDMVSTEYETTLAEECEIKAETTVALDFGTVTINNELKLHLFGTPGQERFDFLWEHLSIGCLGYVVLVDGVRPASFAETRRLMRRFAEFSTAPYIVAANKQDDPAALPLPYLHQQLQLPPSARIVPCIANNRESVRQVLLRLLAQIDSRFAF